MLSKNYFRDIASKTRLARLENHKRTYVRVDFTIEHNEVLRSKSAKITNELKKSLFLIESFKLLSAHGECLGINRR